MENEIIVTVMITYYNQKKYIQSSLKSVISQKLDSKMEIICGDDGSTDGTYEALLEWKKRYPDLIHVIRMPREDGKKYEPIGRVSNSRYTMWEKAHGKYVCFLDGDDYYSDDHKLQKQINLLEKYPKCNACGQPALMLWESDPNKKQEIARISDKPLIIPNKLYWASYWFHADTFVYRNILSGNNTKVNRQLFDDNLITCYFIKSGDVIYSPDDATVYRQVEGSSWNNRTDLQKAYVNMALYCESLRILGWKIACFQKCFTAWRVIFDNRNDGLDLSGEGSIIRDTIIGNPFIRHTAEFFQYGFIKRTIYYCQYYLPTHAGRLFTFLKKAGKIRYKKI